MYLIYFSMISIIRRNDIYGNCCSLNYMVVVRKRQINSMVQCTWTNHRICFFQVIKKGENHQYIQRKFKRLKMIGKNAQWSWNLSMKLITMLVRQFASLLLSDMRVWILDFKEKKIKTIFNQPEQPENTATVTISTIKTINTL